MKTLQDFQIELINLLEANSNLVVNYSVLSIAQSYLHRNDTHSAFSLIDTEQDRFQYVFPEVMDLVKEYKKSLY